jgi:hypothetical protein
MACANSTCLTDVPGQHMSLRHARTAALIRKFKPLVVLVKKTMRG